jgi:hypothetical protein
MVYFELKYYSNLLPAATASEGSRCGIPTTKREWRILLETI